MHPFPCLLHYTQNSTVRGHPLGAGRCDDHHYCGAAGVHRGHCAHPILVLQSPGDGVAGEGGRGVGSLLQDLSQFWLGDLLLYPCQGCATHLKSQMCTLSY